MAKNNTMAAKHAMAKKWAMKEVLDNAKAEMCANANVTTQAKSIELWDIIIRRNNSQVIIGSCIYISVLII